MRKTMVTVMLAGVLVGGPIAEAIAQASAPCCIWRVGKRAQGTRKMSFSTPYACTTASPLTHVMGPVKWQAKLFSSGLPCDELTDIPDGSLFTSNGTMVRRSDDFAQYLGKFTIWDPAGNWLYTGEMTAFDRIGTHHAPWGVEVCDQKVHIEGRIDGRANSILLGKREIHALIVGEGTLPGLPGGTTGVFFTLDGDIIKCP